MPSLEPLEEFICDECGEIIENPEDGWVEWIVNYFDVEEKPYYEVSNFRIVHHSTSSPNKSCYYTDLYNDYEGNDSTEHLHRYLKDKGLSRSLGLMRDYAKGSIEYKTKDDLVTHLDLIRRVTIPYYEESRIYLENHYTDFSGEGEILYRRLDSEGLKRFLEWIEEQEYDKNLK